VYVHVFLQICTRAYTRMYLCIWIYPHVSYCVLLWHPVLDYFCVFSFCLSEKLTMRLELCVSGNRDSSVACLEIEREIRVLQVDFEAPQFQNRDTESEAGRAASARPLDGTNDLRI